MLFWFFFSVFTLLSSSFATAKFFVLKKIEKRREFYTFKNEEGEEIPIGI